MGMMILSSPLPYLTSAWGIFDVVVNSISVVDVIIGYASEVDGSSSSAQALRALRAIRILKALSSHRMVKVLLHVLLPLHETCFMSWVKDL